ncbi:MAG: hypothetical protein NZ518_03465 [Dehalococcoidia bacterium]|nr:hypothetical protein [Dehalococcoidia bacterium]
MRAAHAVELRLHRSEIVGSTPVPLGSNGVYLVDLWIDEAPAGKAIYKPRRDEAPLWDFPDGTLYRREYAAYLVAKAFGWTIVPPTVIRDGPRGIGTLQHYIEHDHARPFAEIRKRKANELALLALFDYVTNNADRKAAHCLLGHDGNLYGIDHGLTFHREAKHRTVLTEFFGQSVDPSALASVRALVADRSAMNRLRSRLSELLDDEEVACFFKRLCALAETGRLPEARTRWSWYW